MSAQPERPTPEPQSTTDSPDAGGVGSFLRHFLVLQALFLLFLLIASIPEAPSPTSPVSAPIQMAALAVLWGVTDAAAVMVETVRERARRHPVRRPGSRSPGPAAYGMSDAPEPQPGSPLRPPRVGADGGA